MYLVALFGVLTPKTAGAQGVPNVAHFDSTYNAGMSHADSLWTPIYLDPAITRDTARVNAAVRVARQVYSEVNAAAASKRLTVRDSTVSCDDDERDSDDFQVFSDTTGAVRKLVWSGGDDDLGTTTEYYYSASARIRFMFQKGASVRGWAWESRWYYDDSGAIVKQVYEISKGRGMFQPQLIARDPWTFIRDFCKQQ